MREPEYGRYRRRPLLRGVRTARLLLRRRGPRLGVMGVVSGIFGRVRERSLPYWADPAQKQAGEINHHDGGRGFYFEDPDGHFLEVITRPYGSGGWNS